MSDKVGVILEGGLAQFAPPREIYGTPISLDVARFLGPVNILPEALAQKLGVHKQNGEYYTRPENLQITACAEGIGEIKEAIFAGHYVKYTIEAEGVSLIVFTSDSDVRCGDRVNLVFKNQ